LNAKTTDESQGTARTSGCDVLSKLSTSIDSHAESVLVECQRLGNRGGGWCWNML
jgi:hypothetical protein